MDPQTASRTALATSLMRALHVRTDPHRILDDPWGDRLVPAEARALVYQMIRNRAPGLPATPDAATQRRAIDASLRADVAYPNVLLRSCFFRRRGGDERASPRYGINTNLPTCRFSRNARCASAMRSRGKVAATRGRISPRSM